MGFTMALLTVAQSPHLLWLCLLLSTTYLSSPRYYLLLATDLKDTPPLWRVPSSGVPLSCTPGIASHSAWRMWLRKFHARVLLGRRPVVNDMRLGEHTVS